MKKNKTELLQRQEAIAELWERGFVSWKLDDNQKEVYKIFQNTDTKIVVFASSRRLGKTYSLCIMGLEQCLQKPNSSVIFIAPTLKMARQITKSIMRQILNDCPRHLMPKFQSQEKVWKFSNGSEMIFAGADADNIESVRGSEAHLILIDEAGFFSDLRYAINSVLIPTTTTTKGKILMASTPPISPSHDFVSYLQKAQLENNLIKKTIYDNPRLSAEEIDALAEEVGGVDSVDFKREYLAEIITDATKAVVPEFTEEKEKKLVQEWKRPPYYYSFMSMDLGFRDFTVVLFAYYDFAAAKVIIEDEIVLNGQQFTTQTLAEKIIQKEFEIFKGKPITLRVSDNNLIVINDLAKMHGIFFIPTMKDDKDSAINQLRMLISSDRIIINPKCKTLIYHLKNAIWKGNRKTYDRGMDGSHFDAVDAAVYLIRNIDYSSNPYPKDYNLNLNTDSHYGPYYGDSAKGIVGLFKKIYKINK
jgi:hypothetical protein